MMQATLLNFGDCTRVVCDSMNRPVSINIGEVVETDLHDAHFHIIKRAVGSDSLMVVPKETKLSPKLQGIIDVLKAVDVEPYDVLMARYKAIVPHEDDEAMRPSRESMRISLRDIARGEVAKALHMQSKVFIREEGDEVTRQPARNDDHLLKEIVPESQKQQPEVEPAKPVKKAGARSRAKATKSSKPAIARERL